MYRIQSSGNLWPISMYIYKVHPGRTILLHLSCVLRASKMYFSDNIVTLSDHFWCTVPCASDMYSWTCWKLLPDVLVHVHGNVPFHVRLMANPSVHFVVSFARLYCLWIVFACSLLYSFMCCSVCNTKHCVVVAVWYVWGTLFHCRMCRWGYIHYYLSVYNSRTISCTLLCNYCTLRCTP